MGRERRPQDRGAFRGELTRLRLCSLPGVAGVASRFGILVPGALDASHARAHPVGSRSCWKSRIPVLEAAPDTVGGRGEFAMNGD